MSLTENAVVPVLARHVMFAVLRVDRKVKVVEYEGVHDEDHEAEAPVHDVVVKGVDCDAEGQDRLPQHQ